jgi:Tfp pilus assembly protein FimT
MMELIITIGIMVTVLAIGGIMLSGYIRNTRLREAVRELHGDIDVIRSTARVRQAKVAAVLAPNSINAFTDTNENSVLDPGEQTILDHVFAENVQFAMTDEAGNPVPPQIRYSEMGTLRDGQRMITIVIPSAPNRQYRITLFSTGISQVWRKEGSGPWTKGL